MEVEPGGCEPSGQLEGSYLTLWLSASPLEIEGMELNGALSNPFATDKNLLKPLIHLHRALIQRAAVNPQQTRSPLSRPSPVLQTVTLVLEQTGQPMRAREIHAAAELLFGEQLLWSSVKASLAAGASGRLPRFERLSHGVYRLARRSSDASSTRD
jgi:hypothetical protein